MNKNLNKAKKIKNDEFYTQLTDIEKELEHYIDHFEGKTVLCNCDDPQISNFFHYFSYNFEKLGLKKLITTCYKNQQMNLFSKQNAEKAIYLEYECTKNGNVPDIKDIGTKQLQGDGDFRSKECIELLKESDIVVTNPPFSLFRKYLAQLIEYDKKFLIIGSYNAVTYKEVFPLIKNNKIWLGCNFVKEFKIPDGSIKKFGNIVWYTNLPHKKRNEELILFKDYYKHGEDFPKYDKYDAIEVSKVINIPRDYNGVMGVPITFLSKFNPKQFEILDISPHFFLIVEQGLKSPNELRVNGKKLYVRILIKKK